MGDPCLVVIDSATRNFFSFFRIALGIAYSLKPGDPTRAHLLAAIEGASILIDLQEPLGENFYQSISAASEKIRKGTQRAGDPHQAKIWAAGHAHIDVAWLWTLDQTRQKAGRTFHNVIRLMDEHPQFTFTQSQPQLYDFVRQDFPELFEAIKQKIAEGQWEAIGGMWVEPDCNIPGGESLVRQLMLGRKFFEQQFGTGSESPVLWLPDVFGFPWSLPQLIKEAELEGFFTIKLGWSQYNRIPYDSFWWQGIDGTRVLTHFSTTKGRDDVFTSTYNATATPDEVLTTWENFQQKDIAEIGQSPPLLMAYGYGDGGGGPTREMVENLLLMENFPGSPKVTMGKAGYFFDVLRKGFGDKLPTWNDELYLEFHRGTYTSQAKNKRANRKCEVLLHNLEFLATIASLYEEGFDYPRDQLEELWKIVCLNQFHDILPGTSIREVYVESQAQYAEVQRNAQDLLARALDTITTKFDGDFIIVNPTSFVRSDLVWMDQHVPEGATLEFENGEPVRMQVNKEGTLLELENLLPYSILPIKVRSTKRIRNAETDDHLGLIAGENLLENDFLKVEFNDAGEIKRIYSKELEQEVIPTGCLANEFRAYEDRPKTPDAWEIDISYEDKMRLAEPAASISVVEKGPLRAALEFKRKILNSLITQRISLDYNARQLKFDSTVDWREKHTLLKVAFPVEVLSPTATYEIQWGDIQRPTHRNTSWDIAKFEVPAQKWVDLSEGGIGVSLLNDCKYGHSIHKNVMQLTLLRSPTYPDPAADVGTHHFTYSVRIHGRDWKQGTIQSAYELNYPHLVYYAKDRPDTESHLLGSNEPFIRVNQPNVIVESIKQAEDGKGVIVRMFESQRMRCKVKITPGFKYSRAYKVNIIEQDVEEIPVVDGSIFYHISPYQILSLRFIHIE